MNPARDLSIVGTACNGYGRFLPAWADSLAALTVRPAAVFLLTHGDGPDAAAGAAAVARLMAAGLVATHRHEPVRMHIALAKNTVTAMTATPWVANLDADDTLFPYALEEVARLADQADVIGFGYERHGEVRGKVSKGRRLYADSVGIAAVTRFYPASGNWPFRRTLWEQRPYRTDLDGAWDTASLIEWAHLGARVKATRRPCFRYFRRTDSVLSQRTRDHAGLSRTNARIRDLHHRPSVALPPPSGTRGDYAVSVLVPRAVGDLKERDAAWAWLRRRYAAVHPDWQVVEGWGHAGTRFCKGRAVAEAVAQSDGAILVIADADCVVPASALRDAVAALEQGAPWVMPHRLVHRLSAAQTTRWLIEAPDAELVAPTAGLARPAYPGIEGGGIVVCRRADYLSTGGIPLAFIGWGAEDEALAAILTGLLGAPVRLPTPLVHLWHPPSAAQREPYGKARNRQLLGLLRAVRADPARLRALAQQMTLRPQMAASAFGKVPATFGNVRYVVQQRVQEQAQQAPPWKRRAV
jgi:hypothetical protein